MTNAGLQASLLQERGGSSHCPVVAVDTSTKTFAATPAVIGEMMGKTRQGLIRPRKLPWPPKLPPLTSSDHRSLALWWSLFIFIMELRKIGLEVRGLIY